MQQQLKLSQLLYPENLEQFSKVTTILNEDFQFKVSELYELKEIQKIFSSKEELIESLDSISHYENPIISFDKEKEEGKVKIDELLMLYSFVNLPSNFNENEVKEFLNLKDGDYIRLYKQSLFWILVSENEEFNENFEKYFKKLKVEDDKNLKCNMTSGPMLKNAIHKIIQKNIYSKEIKDLSVKNTEKKEKIKEDDSMSWRKKTDVSDMSTNSNNNNNLGYGISSNGKKRRQRFKSDPNEYNYHRKGSNDYWGRENKNDKKKSEEKKNEGKKKKEEIQINLDQIKYSLMIKYKYSNKEIVDYLKKIEEEIIYDKNNFKNIIEDVVDNKMKKLEIIEREKFENVIPKNNPLLSFKGGK